MRLRLAALLVGIALTVTGIALFSVPAALITCGVLVTAAALFIDDGKK